VTQPTTPTMSSDAGAVRTAATIGIVAIVVGRALAPALRGATAGLDRAIAYADFSGAFATYLFAIVGAAVALRHVALLVTEARLGPILRNVAAVLALIAIALVLPAMLSGLPPAGSLVLSATSIALATVAARCALPVPRTRALGVMLTATAAAALLHVSGAWLAGWAGVRALVRAADLARGLGTASLLFDVVAMLTALSWLATRRGAKMTFATRIAIVGAFIVAWGAAKGGSEQAATWQIVAHRALERLLVLPTPLRIALPFRYFVEAFAPMLAVVAVCQRREMPGIAGGFALLLLARTTPDIPLCGLGLAIAALAATLASRDERGMWAALLSKP
jgi:hypothetical protein